MTDSVGDTAITAGPEWSGLLAEGERILWQGQPKPGLPSGGRLFMAAFGVLFGAFWLYQARMANWALILLGVGVLAFIVGQSLLALFMEAVPNRVFYTVTNQRVLIATKPPLLPRRLKSFAITPDMPVELRDGGPASILFPSQIIGDRNSTEVEELRRIPDARTVLALIHRIQKGAAA